jgi:uncharacterized membrane protein YfcA
MRIQHGQGLSPFGPARRREGPSDRRRGRALMLIGVRYVIPAAVVVSGLAILVFAHDRDTALEAGCSFFGVALAVVLLNFFFRVGVRGDRDRDREADARAYFDEHGRWPDERR